MGKHGARGWISIWRKKWICGGCGHETSGGATSVSACRSGVFVAHCVVWGWRWGRRRGRRWKHVVRVLHRLCCNVKKDCFGKTFVKAMFLLKSWFHEKMSLTKEALSWQHFRLNRNLTIIMIRGVFSHFRRVRKTLSRLLECLDRSEFWDIKKNSKFFVWSTTYCNFFKSVLRDCYYKFLYLRIHTKSYHT